MPGTCDPQFVVKATGTYSYQLWKFYPCTGDVIDEEVWPEEPLKDALTGKCGPEWVSQYFGSLPSQSHELNSLLGSRPLSMSASISSSPVSGQGSQTSVLGDFNGDGILDFAYIKSSGLAIQLFASDGSVSSSNTYPVGFSTSNVLASNLIAADFNGDGNLDLAISNLGIPGSNSGGIAILLGNGDGTFSPARPVPAGLNPLSLVAADFNGDGKMDIAVANQRNAMPSGFAGGPGTISVLFGNGDGTFASPVTYPAGEDSIGLPDSLIGLDTNGDGLPDLAVANRNDNSVSILLNAGGGKFKQPSVTKLPFGTEYLAYADFDHDGNLDLVAASQRSNVLMMLLGNGDGAFQKPVSYVTGNNPASIGVVPLVDGNTMIGTVDHITGSGWLAVTSPQGIVGAPTLTSIGGSPTGVAVADLNGDGQPDIVTIGAADDVDVFLSHNGQFNTPIGYALGPSPQPQAVAIADVNRDGKPDVVVANNAGSVSVLLGKGDGTFGTPTSTPVDQNANSLALGDFNGDGKLDVAVAAYGQDTAADHGNVTVLTGAGNGTFARSQILTVNGLTPVAVATADLNSDGVLDLAVVTVSLPPLGSVSFGPSPRLTLAVFLGQPGGTFKAATTFQLQGTGENGGIAIGDLNGDGVPDVVAFSNFGQIIDVLLGDGAGAFQEVPTLPTTVLASNAGLTLADVNGDGILDIVTDGSFLLGNGNGTFQTEQPFLSGFNPQAVAVTMSGSNLALVSVDHAGTMVVTALAVPNTSSSTPGADVSRTNSKGAVGAQPSTSAASGFSPATSRPRRPEWRVNP